MREDFVSGGFEYHALDANGSDLALSATEQEAVRLTFKMLSTGYLNPDNLDDISSLRQSLSRARTYHVAIRALEVLQDKLAEAGVDAFAAWLTGGVSLAGSVSAEVLSELTDAAVSSPRLLAEGIGSATIKANVKRLERIESFLRQARDDGWGESPQKPLNLLEIHRMYRDAMAVDTMLLPAGELLQALQPDPSLWGQVKRLVGKILGRTADVASHGAAKPALAAYGAFKSVAEAVPAFADFVKKVDEKAQKWKTSEAGLGTFPPGFDPGSAPSAMVLGQDRRQNVDVDRAKRALPYAAMSLAVYGGSDDVIPAGWSRDRNLETRNRLTGFHGSVFTGPGNEVIVAFEGTYSKSIPDLITDLVQFLAQCHLSKQYKEGLDLYDRAAAAFPGRTIRVTGHSLGGGIAQYVALKRGVDAIVFNAAGLGPATMKNIGQSLYDKGLCTGSRFPGGGLVLMIADLIVGGKPSVPDSPGTQRFVTKGFLTSDSEETRQLFDLVGTKTGTYAGSSWDVPMVVTQNGWGGLLERHGMQNMYNALLALSLAGQSSSEPEGSVLAVVDSSGSMTRTDPHDLRLKALHMLVDGLGDTSAFGLIDFDSHARKVAGLEPLGLYNSDRRRRLHRAIDRVDSDGGTNIGGALKLAGSMLGEAGAVENLAVVLLTDGADSFGWTGSLETIPSDVPIHTIALSSQADRTALGNLSAATGGIHDIAETDEDLVRIMGNLLDQSVGGQALLIQVAKLEQGQTHKADVWVDTGTEVLKVSVAWAGSDMDLNLISPDGRRISIDQAKSSGYGVEAPAYDIIRVPHPAPGRWRIEVVGVDLPPGGEELTLNATSLGSPVRAAWKTSVVTPEVHQPLSIEIDSAEGQVRWENAEVQVRYPDGREEMRDEPLDGLAAVLGGSSGQAAYVLRPETQGVYRVRITAHGRTQAGEPVMRTFDRTFEAVAPGRGVRYRHQIDPFIPRRTPGMLR
ncbi:MAG: VWA domain-containing protein [Gammaproteobacteria bacterium]|nr:MAG: VWA domain-containing protein [Gammaproteobacteria bacterium]